MIDVCFATENVYSDAAAIRPIGDLFTILIFLNCFFFTKVVDRIRLSSKEFQRFIIF